MVPTPRYLHERATTSISFGKTRYGQRKEPRSVPVTRLNRTHVMIPSSEAEGSIGEESGVRVQAGCLTYLPDNKNDAARSENSARRLHEDILYEYRVHRSILLSVDASVSYVQTPESRICRTGRTEPFGVLLSRQMCFAYRCAV